MVRDMDHGRAMNDRLSVAVKFAISVHRRPVSLPAAPARRSPSGSVIIPDSDPT